MPKLSRFRLPRGPQPKDVIGGIVRARRKELGISRAALAERASLDRTYVGSVERGERNPTLPVLVLLTVGLQLPRGALLAAVIDAVTEQDDWLARAIERGSVVE